jgi:hypothetical protein
VSHVTITDPRHFLFDHRLAVLGERSGRGHAYVVVELPDGRKRSVPIASTDLVEAAIPSQLAGFNLPRISVRTLIPLAQHLNRSLSLLTEEVIRDEPASPSASRCVITPDSSRQIQSASDSPCASMAKPVARGANTDRPDIGGAVTADAADARCAQQGDCSC